MRWAEICKKIQKEENRGATLAHGVPAVTWQESQAWGITAHRRAQWRQIPSYCTTAHTITGNWNVLLRQLHPVRLLLVIEWLSFRHAGMLSLRWITLTSCCQAASTFFLSRSYSLAGLFSPQSSLLSAPGKAAWIIEPAVWNSLTGGKQAKSSGFSLAFIPLLYLGIALTLPQKFPHLAWPWDLFSIPEFSIPAGRMNVKHGGL